MGVAALFGVISLLVAMLTSLSKRRLTSLNKRSTEQLHRVVGIAMCCKVRITQLWPAFQIQGMVIVTLYRGHASG
jgi:hypothetical protein